MESLACALAESQCGFEFLDVKHIARAEELASPGLVVILDALGAAAEFAKVYLCGEVQPGDTCVKLCAVGDTGLKTGWVSCVLR